MKKMYYLLILFMSALILSSCDSTTDPDPVGDTGGILVQSTPVGAQIWINGSNSTKVTPDSVTGLNTGNVNVTLKLSGYKDTTFTMDVPANQLSSKSITLTPNIIKYGPVKIYETSGTGPTQSSGVDLSTGMPYGISGSDKDKVDIYYSTAGTGGQGFLVQSASLATTNGLTRETFFNVGSASNLDDHVDSPIYPLGGWTNNMSDRESNYVFLYDDDSNYSKIKIVGFNPGSATTPAWVEVEWYYNPIPTETGF